MRRVLLPLTLTGLLAAAACSDSVPIEPPPPAPSAPRIAYLTPAQHLVRASMTLRGIRPSLDELDAVEKDASALPGIVDEYLASPEFGATIRELFDEALEVKIAPVIYPAGFPARAALAGVEAQQLNDSITDAPLRLIQHVVENDRPLGEIVTADYTMADKIVATVWGLAYDGDGAEWKVTRYTDGREHAGILSDSFLFTRHSTTYSNANRGRANAMSSALLCYDFLSRDINVDASINLADPDEVKNATKKNQACASCHSTLDPLAAYFAGYRPQYVPSFEQSYPIVFNTGPLAEIFSASEPGYFGQQGRGLRYLGEMIAQDPRFSLCAAKRFYSYFNEVSLEKVPVARAAELQRVLTEKNMSAKELARAIVLSDDFRISHTLADDVADAAPGYRKVRPRQLERLLLDLTGFRWQTEFGALGGGAYDPGKIGKIDLVSDPFFGYGVLFGGTDAFYVTKPSHSMNATSSAVLRNAAARAAALVVANDFAQADRSKRKLLTAVSDKDTAEDVVRAQLAALHRRLYGVRVEPSSEEVTQAYTLFSGALANGGGDVRRAWSITLLAMLQDIRIAFY
jgi:hypothetical protein